MPHTQENQLTETDYETSWMAELVEDIKNSYNQIFHMPKKIHGSMSMKRTEIKDKYKKIHLNF